MGASDFSFKKATNIWTPHFIFQRVPTKTSRVRISAILSGGADKKRNDPCMMPGGPMTRIETKGERKRTTTTKQNTVIIAHTLLEEVNPQILSLGTKRLLILRMRHLKWMRIFKKWFTGNRFSFVQE